MGHLANHLTPSKQVKVITSHQTMKTLKQSKGNTESCQYEFKKGIDVCIEEYQGANGKKL